VAKFFNAGIDTVSDYQFPSFRCPKLHDFHLELIGNGCPATVSGLAISGAP